MLSTRRVVYAFAQWLKTSAIIVVVLGGQNKRNTTDTKLKCRESSDTNEEKRYRADNHSWPHPSTPGKKSRNRIVPGNRPLFHQLATDIVVISDLRSLTLNTAGHLLASDPTELVLYLLLNPAITPPATFTIKRSLDEVHLRLPTSNNSYVGKLQMYCVCDTVYISARI